MQSKGQRTFPSKGLLREESSSGPYLLAEASGEIRMLSSTLGGKEKGAEWVPNTAFGFQAHKHLALEFYSFESVNDLFSQDKINSAEKALT